MWVICQVAVHRMYSDFMVKMLRWAEWQMQVDKEEVKVEIKFEEAQIEGGQLKMTACVVVKAAMPEQNERLPYVVEKQSAQVIILNRLSCRVKS
jgi:hypothetical protein